MIIKQASNTLCPYLKKNAQNRLFLAISGGVDSVVLLDILNHIKKKYSLYISLIHINYSMQEKSKESEKLCYDLASKYKINIISKKINIDRKNFESNAREIRYNLFNQYSEEFDFDYILTAHHRDDQIETLHMKFLDNSDWLSFLGIRERYAKVLRPMLDISKKDIYYYAKKNNLKWIEDTSNVDTNYRRNNIRLKMLPEIYKNNPEHIDFLIKKHLEAIERTSILKKQIKSFKAKYIIKINSQYIILSNRVIELSDKVAFKLFYQDLCRKYFNWPVYSTGKHWSGFHSGATTRGAARLVMFRISVSTCPLVPIPSPRATVG